MSRLPTLLRLSAWTALLALMAAIWGQPRAMVSARPAGAVGLVAKDLEYRVGHSHARLDVYSSLGQAESPGPSPAILAIHGGSWIGGSKEDYGPSVSRLAEHGFVVVVPDYQLARAGRPGWPDALDDLRESVRWIRRHAREYRVDPDRIVALGSSAGGQLAMLLGTAPAEEKPGDVSSKVRAVVSLYGPSDLIGLRAHRRLANDPISTLVDDLSPRASGELAGASPDRHVSPDDAPMLLIHGSDDRWVSPEQSLSMADRLAHARVYHRLLIVPGARHGFELMVRFPKTRDLVNDILAFLESVWQVPARDHR